MGRKILMATRRQKKSSERPAKQKRPRWAKGHSCVSNPKTMKHREMVSNTLLHPVNTGSSFLTVKNLGEGKFGDVDVDSDDDNNTVLSSDIASLTISDGPLSVFSTASSVKSLASGWSQVSHNALERFLNRFKGNLIFHKEMLSILSATSEVIDEEGGRKNETDFFANFMALLSTCDPDQYQPLMSLINITIERVSPNVLKLRFEDIYPKIVKILQFGIDEDEELLIRTTINTLGALCKTQDFLNLEGDSALESAFYVLLRCSLNARPRIRKKARSMFKSLISTFNKKSHKNNRNVLPKFVTGWVLDHLSSFPMCDVKTVTDCLTFLITVWPEMGNLNGTGLKKLYESVLRVMSSGDATILKIGFNFFNVVFQCMPVSDEHTDSDIMDKLVIAIWELQPDARNVSCFVLWLSCILQAMMRVNVTITESFLPLLFDKLSPLLPAHCGDSISNVLDVHLSHVLNSSVNVEVPNKCFQSLTKNFLIIPPNPTVLKVTRCLVNCLVGGVLSPAGKEVFLQLSSVPQYPGVKVTLGKFVEVFGIECLWEDCDLDVQWKVILPLVQDNLNNSEIQFWKKSIFPNIVNPDKVTVIWESLVGFCRNPKDPENFPAELVGKVIVEKPVVRLSALSALRMFIEWEQCQNFAIKYSKNYLPLLFNLYTKENMEQHNNGHADSIAITVQKYLGFCEGSLLCQLIDKAFEKLQTEENCRPLYDLIAFMGSRVSSEEHLTKVVELVTKCLQGSTETDEKRMYRILVFLLKNEKLPETFLDKIFHLLVNTKGDSKGNIIALRLECILILVSKNSTWYRTFLSETIMNLINVNSKAKKYAIKIVSSLSCNLKESDEESLEEVVKLAVAGLESGSPLLVASSAYFAFLLEKEIKPSKPNFPLINSCVQNLQKLDDSLVWKYCLLYTNLCLANHKGKMGPVAPVIANFLENPKYPRKEINKIIARMIKVFGATGLKTLLSSPDDPKMRVRIRNINKKLRRIKKDRLKKSEPDDHESDESEDEFGDAKVDKPVVIKEGVVDFLSPGDVTKALIHEEVPRKSAEDEFKETEDGKIIIGGVDEEIMSDDSDDSFVKDNIPRKRKLSGSVTSKPTSHKSFKSSRSHRSTKSSKSSKSNVTPKRNKSKHSANSSVRSFKASKSKRKRF